MESEEALLRLGVDAKTGLNDETVQQRLETHGPNALETARGVSPLQLLYGQFRNVLIIVLLAAAALSALVGETVDAVIILVIVLFSAVLGFVQEYRAERAVEALENMLSPMIKVVREQRKLEVPSRELVPGDIVLLDAGDRVAADIRLIESHSLRCDEAALTGESTPVAKHTKALAAAAPLPERSNRVFGGTTVTYGRGRGVVTETGMQTVFGRIAQEVLTVEVGDTPLEKRTAEIGKWLAIISFSVCGLVAVISVARGLLAQSLDLDFLLTMVTFAVALAVAAVPEALAAIVTSALAIGMHSMAKRNALVKRMPAVETLGCTTVICSDKTGTLTRGEMTIRRNLSGRQMIELSGSGYSPEGELRLPEGMSEPSWALRLLLEGGSLCNDSELIEANSQWSLRGDPTEGAFLVAAEKAGISVTAVREQYPRIREVPFSSERKRMTTTHLGDGGGTLAFMKGAPEVVLSHCSRITDGFSIRHLSQEDKVHILASNENMAGEALRVLALAYRKLGDDTPLTDDALESEMVFLGLVGMMDPPREEASSAVEACKQVGVRTIMITGDHQLTATAVARELGIHSEADLVVNGEQLAEMSEFDLAEIVERVTVYARVSPMDKLKIVRAWKARGQIVAMTGDGVNDDCALTPVEKIAALEFAGEFNVEQRILPHFLEHGLIGRLRRSQYGEQIYP